MFISKTYLAIQELTQKISDNEKFDTIQVRISNYDEMIILTNIFEVIPHVRTLILNIDTPVSQLQQSYNHLESWLNEKRQIVHLGLVEPQVVPGTHDRYFKGWEDNYLKKFLDHLTSSSVKILSLGWQHDVPQEFWDNYFVNSAIKENLYAADVIIISPPPHSTYISPDSLVNLNQQLVLKLIEDMPNNPDNPEIAISCDTVAKVRCLSDETEGIVKPLKDLWSAYQSMNILRNLEHIDFYKDPLDVTMGELEALTRILKPANLNTFKYTVENFSKEPKKLINYLVQLYKELKVMGYGWQHAVFSRYAEQNIQAKQGLVLMFLDPIKTSKVEGEEWLEHAVKVVQHQFFLKEKDRIENLYLSLQRIVYYKDYQKDPNSVGQYSITDLVEKSQEMLAEEQNQTVAERSSLYFAAAILELYHVPSENVHPNYQVDYFIRILTAIAYLNRAMNIGAYIGSAAMEVLDYAQKKLTTFIPQFSNFDPHYRKEDDTAYDNNHFLKAVTYLQESKYAKNSSVRLVLFQKAAKLLAKTQLAEDKMPFVKEIVLGVLNNAQSDNIVASQVNSLPNITEKDFLPKAIKILQENFLPKSIVSEEGVSSSDVNNNAKSNFTLQQ